MTDTTAEPSQPHRYEVSILVHPEAHSPSEAYLMTVDSLIRYGGDKFHPLIIDTETDERFLLTQDGKLVTGEEMQSALEQLQEQLSEDADGSSD